MDREDSMIPWEYDRVMQTRERIDKIPYLNFPEDWEVAVIPPFSGATVRFLVRRKGSKKGRVSVYADFDSRLGYSMDAEGKPAPYWEVYPVGEDVGRCSLHDTKYLLAMIERSLQEAEQEALPPEEEGVS
jgi:hypothetical protein